MAYRDDIIALGANHLWRLDGDVNDSIGTLNYVNAGAGFIGPQICEDTASSVRTVNTAGRAEAATSADFQDVTTDLCMSFWFQTDNIQQPPTIIWSDGGQTAGLKFYLGFGNSLVVEADCDPDIVQVGTINSIAVNRSYHLCLVFRDIGGGSSELELYADGVSQGSAVIADVMSAGRGGFKIGGDTGTTLYSIGGTPFLLVSPVNGRWAMACTFTGANVPTETEIREELFEKGALPDVTITSDTEANMQTALDAYASTQRPDSPVAFRIEAPV